MAHPGFGHLWQQTEMSDVEVVLVVVSESDETSEVHSSKNSVLQQFPGHSQILSSSPLFGTKASV